MTFIVPLGHAELSIHLYIRPDQESSIEALGNHPLHESDSPMLFDEFVT